MQDLVVGELSSISSLTACLGGVSPFSGDAPHIEDDSREIFPLRVSKMGTSRISTFDPISEASASDQGAHGPQNGLIRRGEPPERSIKYVALATSLNCVLSSHSCTGLVALKCQRAPHLRRKNEWLGSGIEMSVVQAPRKSSLFGQARE